MATQKQRRSAEKLVETGGNVSKAMEAGGYSPKTAHTPQKLTQSKGFGELCDELGLTDDLLLNALVEDIKAKKGERKQELELGFKVRGRLKDAVLPGGDKNNPLFILDMSKGGDTSSTD